MNNPSTAKSQTSYIVSYHLVLQARCTLKWSCQPLRASMWVALRACTLPSSWRISSRRGRSTVLIYPWPLQLLTASSLRAMPVPSIRPRHPKYALARDTSSRSTIAWRMTGVKSSLQPDDQTFTSWWIKYHVGLPRVSLGFALSEILINTRIYPGRWIYSHPLLSTSSNFGQKECPVFAPFCSFLSQTTKWYSSNLVVQ